MAIDGEQRELLETYAEVINFLLRPNATDEFVSEAVGDVTSIRQSLCMTEKVYYNHLWDKGVVQRACQAKTYARRSNNDNKENSCQRPSATDFPTRPSPFKRACNS